MSEDPLYPTETIRAHLDRHLADAGTDDAAWLAQVIEVLRDHVAAIPPPAERVDSIPEYIYPH